jgi:hypothetical protein
VKRRVIGVEGTADGRHTGTQRRIGLPFLPAIELEVGDGRTRVLMLMGGLGHNGQGTREAEETRDQQARHMSGTI